MNKHTFSELKKLGWNSLKGKYWYSFAMTLLVIAIVSFCSMLMYPISAVTISNNIIMLQQTSDTVSSTMAAGPLLGTYFLYLLMNMLISILITLPITIGLMKFFINANTYTHNVSDIFFIFKNNFRNVIKILFFKWLYTFLWSLLFIIPGIVKSYEYSMLTEILAENPALDRKHAFEITKAMTNGNKWRIFLFNFSFIGWMLLTCITFGIGSPFLTPYIYASFVQLYFELKENAIANGYVAAEEFQFDIETK